MKSAVKKGPDCCQCPSEVDVIGSYGANGDGRSVEAGGADPALGMV